MSRVLREGVGSVLCLVAMLAALIAIDGRVRDNFRAVSADWSSGGPSDWVDRLAELGSTVLAAARDQSLEHAPLLIFTLVAAVLLLFMLRT